MNSSQHCLQTLAHLETEISFQLRRDIWKDTLSMFRDFPIFGAGSGPFRIFILNIRVFRQICA